MNAKEGRTGAAVAITIGAAVPRHPGSRRPGEGNDTREVLGRDKATDIWERSSPIRSVRLYTTTNREEEQEKGRKERRRDLDK